MLSSAGKSVHTASLVAHDEPSPPHTPHSSSTAVEPHALSHPPTTESPPHTPAQSTTDVP